MSETHSQLIVNLSKRTYDALTALCEYEELNKTTIVNRAVQVYQLISELQRTGGTVVFADSVGNPIRIDVT